MLRLPHPLFYYLNHLFMWLPGLKSLQVFDGFFSMYLFSPGLLLFYLFVCFLVNVSTICTYACHEISFSNSKTSFPAICLSYKLNNDCSFEYS